MNVGSQGKPGESIIETCDVTAYGPGTFHVAVSKQRSGGWVPLVSRYVEIS